MLGLESPKKSQCQETWRGSFCSYICFFHPEFDEVFREESTVLEFGIFIYVRQNPEKKVWLKDKTFYAQMGVFRYFIVSPFENQN